MYAEGGDKLLVCATRKGGYIVRVQLPGRIRVLGPYKTAAEAIAVRRDYAHQQTIGREPR